MASKNTPTTPTMDPQAIMQAFAAMLAQAQSGMTQVPTPPAATTPEEKIAALEARLAELTARSAEPTPSAKPVTSVPKDASPVGGTVSAYVSVKPGDDGRPSGRICYGIPGFRAPLQGTAEQWAAIWNAVAPYLDPRKGLPPVMAWFKGTAWNHPAVKGRAESYISTHPGAKRTDLAF